jgi:hypothetical protein
MQWVIEKKLYRNYNYGANNVACHIKMDKFYQENKNQYPTEDGN